MTIEQKLSAIKKLDANVLLQISEGSSLSMFERYEQITVHKFSIKLDYQFYKNGELIQAALFCINPTVYNWPKAWGAHFKNKIILKSQIERMIIASSFLSSEVDRILFEIRSKE